MHYKPEVTIVGLFCKDSKELRSDSTGNCHCRQPRCR